MSRVALHALEVSPLLRRVDGDVRLLLLVHLPLIHNLLERPAGEEAVDVHVATLANAIRPILRLEIHRGVPGWVEDDHAVGGGYVEAHPAGARRHEKHEEALRSVELVHHRLPVSLLRGAVQPTEDVSLAHEKLLQDVQQTRADAEQDHLVVLPVPQRQQFLQRQHLPAVLRARDAIEIDVGAIRPAEFLRVLAERQLGHLDVAGELSRVVRRVRFEQLEVVAHLSEDVHAREPDAVRTPRLPVVLVVETVEERRKRPGRGTLVATLRTLFAASAVAGFLVSHEKLEIRALDETPVRFQLQRGEIAEDDVVHLLRELPGEDGCFLTLEDVLPKQRAELPRAIAPNPERHVIHPVPLRLLHLLAVVLVELLLAPKAPRTRPVEQTVQLVVRVLHDGPREPKPTLAR